MKYFVTLIILLTSVYIYLIVNREGESISNSIVMEDQKANWLTDFPAAQAMAEEERKPILINFTGSDWCSGCIRLKKDIFSKSFFINYANEHLILLEVDFPLGFVQEESLISQNNYLYDFYEIEGFPTVILIDSEGEIFRDYGYGKDKAENYVNRLRDLLSN